MKKLTCLCFLINVLQIFQLSAQWSKTNGLTGGQVDDLIPVGDTVVAKSPYALFYSPNNGQSWAQMQIPTGASWQFWQVRCDGQRLGAKVSDGSGPQYSLYVTDDLGQNWLSVPLPADIILADFFVAGDVIIVFSEGSVHRTEDNGTTWEKIGQGGINGVYYDGQRMFAFDETSLLYSDDLGSNWNVLHQLGGAGSADLAAQDSLLAIFQHSGGLQEGVKVSLDYGATWNFYPQDLGLQQSRDAFWHGESLYLVTYNGIRKSDDYGQNWTFHYLGGVMDMLFCGISVNNAALIGGSYQGILKSTDDGENWYPANIGLSLNAGKLCPTEQRLLTLGGDDFYGLDADNINWTPMNYPVATSVLASAPRDIVQSADALIMTTGMNPPLISYDNGATWLPTNYPISGSDMGELDVAGGKVFAQRDQGLAFKYFVFNEQALGFQSLVSFSNTYGAQIRSLTTDQDDLYAFGSNKKLYRSTDGGDSWMLVADTVPLAWLGPVTLSENRYFVRGESVFVFNNSVSEPAEQKMLFSPDLGASWQQIQMQGAGLAFGTHAFNDLISVGNYLIAATNAGVFLSEDAGQSWANWSEGLSGLFVFDLEIYEGYVWASVASNGIWKRPLDELDLLLVQGKVFWDTDFDGQQDAGEKGASGMIVRSANSDAYARTYDGGTYTLLTDQTSELLQVKLNKNYLTALPAEQNIPVPASAVDFAIQIDPDARDLSVNLVNVAVLRPGFETDYVLHWRNEIPGVAQNVSLELIFPDDLLDLVSVEPLPDVSANGMLFWYFDSLAANAAGKISMRFLVPASDTIGTGICVEARIKPTEGDLAPNDNVSLSCTTVVGSFDPNDKQSEPRERITPQQIADNESLVYTVRFQNTGNYPAAFVRIIDTIQPGFDVGTFRFLSSSHACNWTLKGRGIVEFFCDNIQLPPAVADEPGSHGFVQYALQAEAGLPLGTPLYNTAHIYFDYNAPITTNTTETVVNLPNATQDPKHALLLNIYPNPARNLVRVETPGADMSNVSVFDAAGRLVLSSGATNSRALLDVHALQAGVYRVIVRGKDGTGEGVLLINR